MGEVYIHSVYVNNTSYGSTEGLMTDVKVTSACWGARERVNILWKEDSWVLSDPMGNTLLLNLAVQARMLYNG